MIKSFLLPLGIFSFSIQAWATDAAPTFHHDNQRTGRTSNVVAASRVNLWSLHTGGSIEASPIIGKNGTVYLASTDGKLYAISAQGDLQWTFAASDSIFSTPAVGADGTIYLGDSAGLYYAVNSNGTQKWVCTLTEGSDRRIIASPVVDANGQSYVASWNNYFYAIGSDGKITWSVPLQGLITASPTLDLQGNVYVASLGDWDSTIDNMWDDFRIAVYKFAPNSPTPVWKFNEDIDINRNRIVSSPAIDAGRGRIYFGVALEKSGVLYALNLSDGTKAFQIPFPKGIISSPAVGNDGTLFVGCLDGKLYAIEPEIGAIRWDFATPAYYIMGSPTIDGAGTIFVGDSDGVLHAISAGGQELWQFSTQSNISSAPAIGDNGTLYLTSYDSNLYALGIPTKRYYREQFVRDRAGKRPRP